LVKLVEENKWEDFGFLIFRTYFGDDTLWQQFRKSWDSISEHGFETADESEGLERIRERLFMKFVDDDITDGTSAEGVAFAYRLFTEDEEELDEDERLEPGLRTRMCLFVDEECMRSVSEPDPSIPFFVKAVDVELGAATQQRPGASFRVAVKDVITEFYPALHLSGITDVSELRPLKENDVWTRLSLSFYGQLKQIELQQILEGT